MKILVAEDDPSARRILEVFLTRLGHDLVVVDDGAEALVALQQPEMPRLVILDWMMPEMDGLEVCRTIRSRGIEPYVYVMLVTTKAQRQDIVQGFEAGADDYIVKPFDLMELQGRLGAGIRIIHLHDQLTAAREELRFQAMHDSLTGMANRAAILQTLAAEVARSQRLDTPLGIAMADVDLFKQVNDTHGHLVGDEILKEVAHRLRGALRVYDSVGRFGGEEFLVVMPGCDSAVMQQQAERLRASIAGAPFQTAAGDLDLTLSLGIATCKGTPSLDATSLLGTADAALYRAKMQGRNRVEPAWETGPEPSPPESADA